MNVLFYQVPHHATNNTIVRVLPFIKVRTEICVIRSGLLNYVILKLLRKVQNSISSPLSMRLHGNPLMKNKKMMFNFETNKIFLIA